VELSFQERLICEGDAAVAVRFDGAAGAAAEKAFWGKAPDIRTVLQKMIGKRIR
jgi:hypothetical protein